MAHVSHIELKRLREYKTFKKTNYYDQTYIRTWDYREEWKKRYEAHMLTIEYDIILIN